LRTAGWGFARVFSLVALAVAWELAARSGAFTPYMLPALSAVLARIWSDLVAGDLVLNTGVTLYRALIGFLLGAAAGVARGLALGGGGHGGFAESIPPLVLRSDHFSRLPDAEDRLPAGGHAVARCLRHVQDHDDRGGGDLPGGHSDDHRNPRRRARAAVVGAPYGRDRARAVVADRPAAGAPAKHHRAASGASHRAHRRNRDGDVHGRLWARRRDEHRLALCRFARRVRRHRGDRGHRLRAGQGRDVGAAAPVAVAPGGFSSKDGVVFQAAGSWMNAEVSR